MLAWSDDDGDFWRSGRDDVRVETVGSQLLWDAAEVRPAHRSTPTRRSPTSGRATPPSCPAPRLVQAALRFCREHGATYRPHPSERDKVSRLTHAGYRRAGITVDGAAPAHPSSEVPW